MKWLLLAAAPLCVAAQLPAPGPQVATYRSSLDGADQPYALYVPKGIDGVRKFPLVVTLHAEGSTYRFSLQQLFSRENLEGRRYPASNHYFPPFPDIPMVVVAPFARGTLGYQGIAEKDVYDVIQDVKARLPIDDDRVYLTGVSMGGGGALWLGLTQPDLWAAVAAVCPIAPPDAETLAPNALNLPVRLYQGAADPIVPAATTRRWNMDFAHLDSPVEYTEYPRAGHPVWTFAYKDGAIFDWFEAHRRNRFPERVRFVTDLYRYAKAYWVRLDQLEAGQTARIDIRFTGPNRITASTGHLDGFTLNLAGHPSFSPARPLTIDIDGTTLRLPKPGALSFHRTNGAWQTGPAPTQPGRKHAGAEGPIAAAFAGPQIYVYGTGGSPTIDDLIARRNQAEEAADWAAGRVPAKEHFRVAADHELHSRDLAGHSLILFGTRETNSWIASFADHLPVALNPSAADYGLVFIRCWEGRTIVVNSGLPWWTGADVAGRPGLAFLPSRYRTMLSFPDYILFKGSLENVVAEGSFTDDWKIPAADLAKMKQTGAIENQ